MHLGKGLGVALEAFIEAPLLCRIQQLEVHIGCSVYLKRFFTLGIFTCKTLVALELSCGNMDLNILNSVSLQNLKVLHLEYVDLVDEDSIYMLIQGCPSLEELCLHITSTQDKT